MIMIILFPEDTTYPEGFLNPGDVRESVAFLDIEHEISPKCCLERIFHFQY